MAPNKLFIEGERILCYHGPLMYEAKILSNIRFNEESNTYEYRVHYAGWNKNWDEWVPENRVLKFNDENIKKKELLESQNANKRKKKNATPSAARPSKNDSRREGSVDDADSRSSTPSLDPRSRVKNEKKRESPSSDTPKAKRSNVKQDGADIDLPVKHYDIILPMPEELHQYMVDDYILIQKRNRKVQLPAKITVTNILSEFLAYWKASVKSSDDNIEEIVSGIKSFFNSMVPKKLLFDSEKSIHEEICKDREPADVYGSVHFLRFFVRIADALIETKTNEQSLATVVVYLKELLKYLGKNVDRYFNMSNYS